MTVDPEYSRWRKKYPKFPGVAVCAELLRRRNVQGGLVDIICEEIQAHARDHAAELIAAFQSEQNAYVRRLLFGAISEAALPDALPLFVTQLRSSDLSLQQYAERGLQLLNTPEARKALWEFKRDKTTTD